ncbi:MAG: hypothetical protein Q9169_001763 [Polycauliona sp. 2 TL-2023]
MSFFSLIQKKGSKPIPPAPNSIRKETVHGSSNAKKTSFLDITRPKSAVPVRRRIGQKATKDQSRVSVQEHIRKRKKSQHTRLVSDSESAESDAPAQAPNKRSRTTTGTQKSIKRQLRSSTALSDVPVTFPMVHASDVAALDKPTKYRLAFPQQEEQYALQLQYPSASQQETFNLLEPLQKDDFKPLEDITETLEIAMNCYFPPADAAVLKDDSHGLLRRLKRARDKRDGAAFMLVVEEWNNTITQARTDGRIARVLDESTELDLKLVERILTQTYARTVSPRVSTLRQYENGTDNVYGELLPKFVSEIFRVTELGSNHVFVDLGSGVGNVILQAALEVGCESWGCEIMENACVLAELQEHEFKARCRLWGLAVGNINLERGDFLENQHIIEMLPKADVILVNNQAFTPELNDRLTSHFLDLKEGCQVVSLNSFVPAGHRITSRNLNSAYNVLEVTEKRYYSACVSWTDAPGSYYVSRKDSSRLRAYSSNVASV